MRRFFWGPWMFSPATVLCIVALLGCVWLQASGLMLPRMALIYLGGIEGASIVGALVCSAISINRASLSTPAEAPPDHVEPSRGLSSNPAASDAYPMPPPEPEPDEEEAEKQNDRVVSLDSYRRR